VTDALPDYLITYLERRQNARAKAVATFLASLTDRERALVQDAAVMGYVRGSMHPRSEEIPLNKEVLAEVIDACFVFPDLYPAVCAEPEPEADEAQAAPADACQFHSPTGSPCDCGHGPAADCHPKERR
jgi:hypothetical protein